jgi:hypothetical protein
MEKIVMENLEQSNDQMVNDFFSDAGGLIDQDTGADVIHPVNEPQQPVQSQSPGQVPPVLNANNATNQNPQQPAITPQQPSNPQQQTVQQQAQAKGFEQSFFKDDGKGNQVFDADSAMNFFMNPKDTSFQYPDVPNYRQMSQQTEVQQPEPVPQQPATQPLNVFDQIEQYADNMRANVLGGYERAISIMQRQGLWKGDNLDAVNLSKEYDALKTSVEQNIKEKRSQLLNEYESKKTSAGKEAEEMVQIKARSETNLLTHYNKLGGQDKFNTLIFGNSVNGKLVGGYGVEIINQMFDQYCEYSGKEAPKDRQSLNKAYNDFWTKIASNPSRLQHVVDVAQSRLWKSVFPQIVNEIRARKDTEINQRLRGAATPAPSQIQAPSSASELDALDKYFGASQHMADQFDTI